MCKWYLQKQSFIIQWPICNCNGIYSTIAIVGKPNGNRVWHCAPPRPCLEEQEVLLNMPFNICMKPLREVICGRIHLPHCTLVHCGRGDDDQFHLFITLPAGGAIEALNQCLQLLKGWMKANRVKLNLNKSEVLLERGPASQWQWLHLLLRVRCLFGSSPESWLYNTCMYKYWLWAGVLYSLQLV